MLAAMQIKQCDRSARRSHLEVRQTKTKAAGPSAGSLERLEQGRSLGPAVTTSFGAQCAIAEDGSGTPTNPRPIVIGGEPAAPDVSPDAQTTSRVLVVVGSQSTRPDVGLQVHTVLRLS